MRVKEPIVLLLPSETKMRIDSYLKDSSYIDFDKEYLYYIVDYLLALESIKRTEKNEYILLKTVELKSIFQSERKMGKYINALVKQNVIECDSIAIQGRKSYHYKSKPINIDRVEEVVINVNGKLYKTLVKIDRLANKNDNRLPIHLKEMKNQLKRIGYEYDEAIEYVNSNYEGKEKVYALRSIYNLKSTKTRYFKRNKTNNRLDTNLTNLKSELRQFIIGDYVNIDLRNSQPYLLSQFIDILITNKDDRNLQGYNLCCKDEKLNVFKVFDNKELQRVLLIPQLSTVKENEEIIGFKKICSEGLFYDYFLELESSEGMLRKEVKAMMFAILFSRNYFYINRRRVVPYKSQKERFETVYPIIYEITRILKDKEHGRLAIALQLFESFIFIDIIAKELCENGIIPLTIHDSFMVKREHEEKALAIVTKRFDAIFGSVPKFNLEAA